MPRLINIKLGNHWINVLGLETGMLQTNYLLTIESNDQKDDLDKGMKCMTIIIKLTKMSETKEQKLMITIVRTINDKEFLIVLFNVCE